MALFSTIFLPNADGTPSATRLTNANTAFVHTFFGDDTTGDGTRERPFKTINRANQLAGRTNILFAGVVNEFFSTTRTIIGDNKAQVILISLNPVFNNPLNCKILGVFLNPGFSASNVILKNLRFNRTSVGVFSRLLFSEITDCSVHQGNSLNGMSFERCTISNTQLPAILFGAIYNIVISNCIVINSFAPSFLNENRLTRYNNCVISTKGKFYFFNGVNRHELPPIAWTNDSRKNATLLRQAYIATGLPAYSEANMLLMMPLDALGNETCLVINEEITGGDRPNIVLKYDSEGNIVDYVLNNDKRNEALYADQNGAVVGANKAGKSLTRSTIFNIENGTEVGAGNLLEQNTDGTFEFNAESSQVWNRLKTTQVEDLTLGESLFGNNAQWKDGSIFGTYIGKKQNPIDSAKILAGGALEPNTHYRVYNDSGVTVEYSAIYRGTNYTVNTSFFTDSENLTFQELTAGSGTYLRKVNGAVRQSIEVQPYDTLTDIASGLPPMSIPLGEQLFLLTYRAGNTFGRPAGTPVLFSDSQIVSDKKVLYADYGITNADIEFTVLEADTANYQVTTPPLRYFTAEINAHYDGLLAIQTV